MWVRTEPENNQSVEGLIEEMISYADRFNVNVIANYAGIDVRVRPGYTLNGVLILRGALVDLENRNKMQNKEQNRSLHPDPEHNMVIDVWQGPNYLEHAARFFRKIGEVGALVEKETKAGYLVVVAPKRMIWGDLNDFDNRKQETVYQDNG